MPIIKPVSDLRNYPEVLKNVQEGTRVYLTKNGTGRYVLMDIGDFGHMECAMRLSYELSICPSRKLHHLLPGRR